MKAKKERKRTKSKLPDRWYQKAAGAALAAGAGMLATPSDAQADITVWTPNVSTTGTTGSSNIFFDFLTGTTETATFTGAQFQLQRSTQGTNGQGAFFYALNVNNHVIGNTVSPYFYPAKLATDAAIGNAGPWLTAAGTGFQSLGFTNFTYGNWDPPSGIGYLGLRFGDGTNFNYGWAEISIDAGANITLSRFAYNTTLNESINAGQTAPVPEPSSTALLVLGAAGLAAYRKRRHQSDIVETESSASV